MLKQNLQKTPKERKLYQAVLKHKVRNLRAKVQSLLPIHFCQKIFKRNTRLRNQQQRMQQLHFNENHTRSLNSPSHTQTPWKYTSGYNLKKNELFQKVTDLFLINQSEKNSRHVGSCHCSQGNEFFFDEEFLNIANQTMKNGNNSKDTLKGYHFEKLTNEEIQQIQEDKLYYLGEEKHIRAYEQFIKEKNMRRTTVPISNEVYKAVSKSFINIESTKKLAGNKNTTTKTSLESSKNISSKAKKVSIMREKQPNRRENHSIMQPSNEFLRPGSNRQSLSQEIRLFRNTTNEKPVWNVTENLARINEEEQIKRILLSMELKTKQQRVEENFKKIMNTRIQVIEQENLKEHFKILNAQQKKRKIHQEVGQIVDLTEKLRKKCIQRKSIVGKQNINSDGKTVNEEK